MPVDLSTAIECHRQGRLDQATRLYQAALALEPENADALHLLGLVTLQRGDPAGATGFVTRAIAVRPAEASYHATLAEAYWALGQVDRTVSAYQTALGLQPDHPEYHCNLGATLVDLGAVDGAIAHFREAIRIRPDFAAAHNNLGNALRLMGDRDAAIDEFHTAVQLDPTSAEARSNLGEMLLDAGLPTAALAHCREAVHLRPDSPLALTNLGNAFHTLGQLDEAQACFREAIRHKPDLAAPHAALAGLLEELGDFDQSERQLREALQHDPRHAGALARLATRLRQQLPDADRRAIEALLDDPGLFTHDRCMLQFGLAQVCDAGREFDRAAELARQANALQRADFQARGKNYDSTVHQAFIDRLIATFTSDYFARVRGFGLPSRRPVFVVGLPRSGTTLVEQILASHPSVFGAGELRLVREILDLLPESVGKDAPPLDCIAQIEPSMVQTLARRHDAALEAMCPSALRVVDKMPENTLYLGWISTLFPLATLIYCRRDPRDVALSCWMTHLAQVRWASDPDHIASRINNHLRLMDHWRLVLPVPIHEVDYESLVADPEPEARSLVAGCGLEWDPACLNFHETRRPVRTASASQVRQPVHARSVGRWKNYERSLADLFETIKDNQLLNTVTC
jgi:tetratricopeptide (TPR) repeat protein